jgi:peptidoglycan/LPS O-acetylase OafA/YrhL
VAAIDALRAIAVLAVMAFHMQPRWLPGGFAGVDVFLVISGYVISRSMLQLDSRGLLVFAAAFYARRARRILPALLVCLVVTCVAAALLIPDSWLARTNHITASYAFWGLSNYFMMHYGDPYFAPRIDFNPSAHTWSLGVEEQFYWVYPLVFFAWLRLRVRDGRARHIGFGLLALLTGASLGYSAYLTVHAPAAAYYSLASRFWELGAGALLFQLHDGRTPNDRPRTALLCVALGIVALGLTLSRDSLFPVPWALAAVLGTALAIHAAVMRGGGRPVPLLSTALPQWAGTRSYSLYLWHWPVYVLFRWTVGLEGWLARSLSLLLIAALSEASYRWVETPFRKGFRRVSPPVVIAASLCCVFVLWRGAATLDRVHDQLSLSVTSRSAVWYPSAWEGESTFGQCHVIRSNQPFAGGELSRSRREGCDGEPVRLFVTGNSHAVAYSTLLMRLGEEQPYDITVYYRSGCGLLQLSAAPATEDPACRRFYHAILEDIASRARRGDVLFLPSLRVPRLGDQWARFSASDVEASWRRLRAAQPAALADAERTLSRLEREGLRVVLEAPKPIFRAPPFRCSDWFNRSNPICRGGLQMPREALLQYRRPVLDALQRLQDEKVSIWDPFDTLCPGATCEAVPNGTPLFFDGDHLSGYANELLYKPFVAFLAGQAARRPGG